MGLQPEAFEGATLWIVPNPSGLNAHETVDSLAAAYRRAGGRCGSGRRVSCGLPGHSQA